MTEERKKQLLAEAENLKIKWNALSSMANGAHESGNHCRAWSLLAKMIGVLAEEAKISMEFMGG